MQYNVTYREKDKGIQVIVQYKDQYGKWRQKTKQGFKKKSIAKLYADKIIEELKENYKYNDDFNQAPIKDLKELYLNHIKVQKEFNTYTSINDAFKRFNLDDIIIKDLKRIDIQNAVDNMVSKFSPGTISQTLEIFKTFLNWASITFEVKIPSLKGINVPKSKKTLKKALEPIEVIRLLKIYETKKDYSLNYYIAVLLAVKAGLRAGEICGLMWSDIDFKNQTITISRQLKRRKEDGKYVLGDLKSKNSYRIIPMSTFLSNELQQIKKDYPINIDNRLISIAATVTLTVNLDLQLKKGFGVTLHELRHTFATNLIANNIDFKTAANILGHDVKETMETYSHVTDAMMDNAKKIINNI